MNTITRMYRLENSELFTFATSIPKAKKKFSDKKLTGRVHWVRNLKNVKPWQSSQLKTL